MHIPILSTTTGGAAEGRPPLLVYSIGICIGICIGVYICIYVYEHGYAHHSMGEEFSPHAMVAGTLNSRLVLYKYNIIKYNTIQYNTIQYNII